MTISIACVAGTRPEAIKMAPVIMTLRERPWARVTVVATAQHRELADDVFDLFEIVPDIDLDLMHHDQTLSTFAARAMAGIDDMISRVRPDLVAGQGDTTTVMAVATVCFYRKVPFLHVEAGLRSFNLDNPFPEEFNRIVASRGASLHFAPTRQARVNLLNEGVEDPAIVVTGNTVIDVLLHVAAQEIAPPPQIRPDQRLVLITTHRRENFGEPLENVCRAVGALAAVHAEVAFLWPVHPNPNVSSTVRATLSGLPNVHLVPPLNYRQFVAAVKHAHLILLDSGGVQEEAPALGRPVLVLRRTTERPEAVAEGVARLVGTDTRRS